MPNYVYVRVRNRGNSAAAARELLSDELRDLSRGRVALAGYRPVASGHSVLLDRANHNDFNAAVIPDLGAGPAGAEDGLGDIGGALESTADKNAGLVGFDGVG